MAKLRARDCRQFIETVTQKSEAMGIAVSIAVVNAEGHLIALERMDDASFITPEIAWGKAFTVAAFRSMSPRFPDGLTIQQWFKERNPQMLINASNFTNGRVVVSGGAFPIFDGDEMIGAYGISGGTSDQDQVLAIESAAAVGWHHTKEHDDTPEDVKQHINELYSKIPGLKNQTL